MLIDVPDTVTLGTDTPGTDTDRDPVVVVDAVVVSDEVDVAVALAETVSATTLDVVLVDETLTTVPVYAGFGLVTFAQIGAVAAAEDREADASETPAFESADEAADGMAD